MSKLTSTVRAEAVVPVKRGVAVRTIHTLSRRPSEHDNRSVLFPSCNRFIITIRNPGTSLQKAMRTGNAAGHNCSG